MKPRIKSTQTLHEYIFDENGGMAYRPCHIVKMAPKKELVKDCWVAHSDNNRICYMSDDSICNLRRYVDELDVDERFSTFSKYKTLVLTEQDDEKAVQIYVKALEERIEELGLQIKSFEKQIEEAKEKLAGWATEREEIEKQGGSDNIPKIPSHYWKIS